MIDDHKKAAPQDSGTAGRDEVSLETQCKGTENLSIEQTNGHIFDISGKCRHLSTESLAGKSTLEVAAALFGMLDCRPREIEEETGKPTAIAFKIWRGMEADFLEAFRESYPDIACVFLHRNKRDGLAVVPISEPVFSLRAHITAERIAHSMSVKKGLKQWLFCDSIMDEEIVEFLTHGNFEVKVLDGKSLEIK